jgi:uncharacterized protein (TIGR02246 family)
MSAVTTALLAWACLGLGPTGEPSPPAQAPQTGAPAAAKAKVEKGKQDALDRPEDVKAINALAEAFTRAFNAADVGAVADTFTTDAQIVDEQGAAFTGRDAVRDRFAQAFENNPGATLVLEVQSLRFLGPDTAIERGRSSLQPANAAEAADMSPYTVVYVKRNGKWLQASVQDHPAAPEPETDSNYERLKVLEWMVGEWVNESPDSLVLTTCKWEENKNFLLHEFTIRIEGQAALSGTQRIGWDPVRKQIHSWMFDSEGGFGEGLWSRNDEGDWIVRASGTRRDGRTAEATRIITQLDDHRILWKSVDRTLGGKVIPDIDAFVMARKPPAPMPAEEPKAKGTPKPAPNAR